MPLSAAIALLALSGPPVIKYDKVRDETTVSTGIIEVNKPLGYEAHYWYKGKDKTKPETVVFSALVRWVNASQDPARDKDCYQWADVKTITLNIGGQIQELPAEYHTVTTDSHDPFLGDYRSVGEVETVKLPVETFLKMATTDTSFAVGRNEGTIRLKGRVPIEKVASTISA